MKAPFRLGTTSFIYPQGWAANVRLLAGRFEDVELLFFEGEALPSAEEVQALAALKAQAGMTYSLHTPLDVQLASAHALRRRASLATLRRALAVAAPLRPEATIVHVQAEAALSLKAFRAHAAASLAQLLDAGIPPETLCVETLDFDFSAIAPVVTDLGLCIAMDVGHFLRDGRDERHFLSTHLPRIRVIQWHGVDGHGRDHTGLQHYPSKRARWLVDALLDAAYGFVLTLEVFNEAQLEASLKTLAPLLTRRGVALKGLS